MKFKDWQAEEEYLAEKAKPDQAFLNKIFSKTTI